MAAIIASSIQSLLVSDQSKGSKKALLVIPKRFLNLRCTPNRKSTSIRTSKQAVEVLITHLYSTSTAAEDKQQRNQEIRRLFAEGLTKADIARRFGISERRVGQIIEEENG
jgi:DNA-binding NarL/FixJ family response regulator